MQVERFFRYVLRALRIYTPPRSESSLSFSERLMAAILAPSLFDEEAPAPLKRAASLSKKAA